MHQARMHQARIDPTDVEEALQSSLRLSGRMLKQKTS
jgi:hypothetical protein